MVSSPARTDVWKETEPGWSRKDRRLEGGLVTRRGGRKGSGPFVTSHAAFSSPLEFHTTYRNHSLCASHHSNGNICKSCIVFWVLFRNIAFIFAKNKLCGNATTVGTLCERWRSRSAAPAGGDSASVSAHKVRGMTVVHIYHKHVITLHIALCAYG